MHLKELRLEKGLLQKDIAELLGVDRTTYAKYETEASEPNRDTLIKLAEIFDTSTDYLLGRTDQKEKPPTESEELSSTELELVNAYRDAPANVQAAIRTLLGRK